MAAPEVIDAALATAGKPCELGTDPSKYLERFNDWYEHTSLLADSVGIKNGNQKLRLVLLWGGKDFRKFGKDAGVTLDGDNPDELDGAIKKFRDKCGSHVNLAMAMFKLMHAKQGTKTVTEFAREVDAIATECQFDTQPYTKERAMKDAIVFGTSDDKLRHEALAKDLDLDSLLRVALGYEQSRRSSGTIKTTTGDDVRQVKYTQDDVDNIVARVVAGKYSIRNTPGASGSSGNRSDTRGNRSDTQRNKCPNCPPSYRPHDQYKCPARGKTCVVCKKTNHFAGSSACRSEKTVRAVADEYNEGAYSYDCGHVEVVEIGNVQSTKQDNRVGLKVNGEQLSLFVDSGCKKTLIPRDKYTSGMGRLDPSKVRLRPYGTAAYLQVDGEVSTTLECENGARHNTTVYVVNGHLAEPLLGDTDAKTLGILSINSRGHHTDKQSTRQETDPVAGITANIRAAGIQVKADKDTGEEITNEERQRINKIVGQHEKAFKGIGLLANEEVHFHIDRTVPPVVAPYRPIPLAYQERVSAHLQELREANKIEDVKPNTHCPWISNVVVTEKKQADQIRMNIDMREPNKALKRTKRHVETIQEMRHKLKGATRFSEMDMGHGFHQVALAEDSRSMSTFQTHEGLHRFKVLFFGPSPAPDLFHDRIKNALHGLEGCTSIHDNIIVWGDTPQAHETNLDACLARLEEVGLTLRAEKCTFGATSVSWFGWIFSKSGISADPKKVQSIKAAGRPKSTEEVKSFLQACQFNAKFMFDTDNAYAQITRPLRDLLKKDVKFEWLAECEEAYLSIMQTMISTTALRPFDPKLKSMHVSDAGPDGIASSVFQEDGDGTWVPIDHASRSLTPCEQNYSQIEKESLAQAWGIQTHRHYLLGVDFDTYTDHQPLIPIYNKGKKGNARVERHRLQVQGFQYTMKYLPGKQNPCDYQSRHPVLLSSYTDQELDGMFMDRGDELCISKIITDDLPDAVTLEMIQHGTKQDDVMQKLIKCLKSGYIGSDPDLKDYRQVFTELAYVDGVLLRGDKLIVPDAALQPGTTNLRQMVVDLAHEGHQGVVKCKQLLRHKIWFPHLDKLVETRVASCLGCQATTYTPTRDPLQPTKLPAQPWQIVDMDFWGPLPSGEYLLVMIDEYSRYPEVEFVSGTSARVVVPHIDRVFSTHGFPAKVKTDGGPPFNGSESHEYQMYMKWAGVKTMVVSPDDPEANGLAENFMKVLSKTWHIARIEGKNYKQEIYRFLRQYRATPHSVTKRAPAEVLFNRNFQVRLPEFQEPAQDIELRQQNEQAKAKQKAYKDKKSNVRPHNIQVGDKVLLLQRTSKTKSRYDPKPFTVVQVQGTQITAERGDKRRRRDAQKFKKVERGEVRNYHNTRYPLDRYKNDDVEFSLCDYGRAPRGEIPPPDDRRHQNPQNAAGGGGQHDPRNEVGDGGHHNPQNAEGGDNLEMPANRTANPIQQANKGKPLYDYPNKHLDPNIDLTLDRRERNRNPTKAYDAQSGHWI
jgi:hypothetical protein